MQGERRTENKHNFRKDGLPMMNLNQIKIDAEFQGKIPPLTFEELNQLETNILQEGRILNPIILWNGTIVDGHNRFTIAKKHPEIPFSTHEKDFSNRQEAIVWICKNQLGRRNLTPEQKKYLIGKQYEAEKKSHGANDGFRGNQHDLVSAENRHLPVGMQTCARIAKENGVGKTYVKDAEQYAKGIDAAEEAIPGIKQKVLSGEVKSTATEIASIAAAPPAERPALISEICKPKKRTASPQEKSSCFDKVTRQQILELANNRYHSKQLANGAAMLCEVSGAANTMIRRWESTFQEYPDILTEPENWTLVENLINKLQNYLEDVKKRQHCLPSTKSEIEVR